MKFSKVSISQRVKLSSYEGHCCAVYAHTSRNSFSACKTKIFSEEFAELQNLLSFLCRRTINVALEDKNHVSVDTKLTF